MKIFVTGGTGFIGTHLVHALLQGGHVVRVLCRTSAFVQPLIAGHPRLECVAGDVLDPSCLDAALDGVQYVYHLAWSTLPKSSNENPSYDIETNLMAALRLMDACRRHGVRRVVFVSSGGTVYGAAPAQAMDEGHPCNPISSYGIVKLSTEKYLHLYRVLHGLDGVTLRLSNPYGEFQRVGSAQGAVSVFLDRAIRRQAIEIWGDGSVVRDYVYVGDVAEAMVRVIDYTGPERIFNIGSGAGMDLNQVIGRIERTLGHAVARTHKPARPFDVQTNVLDTARAARELGWTPRTDFDEGLARTAAWIRARATQAG